MLLLGITAFILFAVMPVAGLWTWHIQEMAKLKAKNAENISPNELTEMRREVTELRQMVTSLAINVENMKDNNLHVAALEDRMKVGE